MPSSLYPYPGLFPAADVFPLPPSDPNFIPQVRLPEAVVPEAPDVAVVDERVHTVAMLPWKATAVPDEQNDIAVVTLPSRPTAVPDEQHDIAVALQPDYITAKVD